jgi:hypothetical protein
MINYGTKTVGILNKDIGKHKKVPSNVQALLGILPKGTLSASAGATVMVTNTLKPGEKLEAGEYIRSKNGGYILIMHPDGAALLYNLYPNPKARDIWNSGTFAKAKPVLEFSKDGNLAIFCIPKKGDKRRHFCWQSNTPKHPKATLALQNDGNLVLYDGPWTEGTKMKLPVLWSTGTYGGVRDSEHHKGGFFSGIGHFFQDAAKVAGGALHAVSQGVGAVAKLAGKIPLVGPALHTTFDVALGAPFGMADNIAHGRRVDKAVLDNLKRTAADAKTLGPYVQSVVSFVPGVGQGISGVIGASIALADGHNIGDALQKGVLSAVPGGPIGQSLAKVSVGVMKGERIDHIALEAIPLPDAQKKLVGGALQIMSDVANKRNVSKDLLGSVLNNIPGGPQQVVNFAKKNGIPVEVAASEFAIKTLPHDVQKAVKIGATLGHAANLQNIKKTAVIQAVPKIKQIGIDKIAKAPALQALSKTLKDTSGFQIATGLMEHKSVSPSDINNIRSKLKDGDQKKGFDMAMAAKIGAVTSAPKKGTPAQLAGYYVTKGMKNAPKKQKISMMKHIKKDKEMAQGAVVASKEVEGWWPNLLKYFGLL